ncbi:MAG: GspH/FimT family pseudopilin [Azoarcus sp.]|jgi:prepilin-type N-terminal cleavage/methylation domain-containing protein|nr:GspH/FimT family pseudopilin [Azoarcus sp.]
MKPCPKLKTRPARGFTLVELMIVLTIFAILLAFAAPSFDNLIKKMTLVGAANEISSGLQYARTEARRANKSTQFTLDPTNHKWEVRLVDDATLLLENTFSDRITVQNAVAMEFLPGGRMVRITTATPTVPADNSRCSTADQDLSQCICMKIAGGPSEMRRVVRSKILGRATILSPADGIDGVPGCAP